MPTFRPESYLLDSRALHYSFTRFVRGPTPDGEYGTWAV